MFEVRTPFFPALSLRADRKRQDTLSYNGFCQQYALVKLVLLFWQHVAGLPWKMN